VIENGSLDLNGHTLQTSSGTGLTIVFTGTDFTSSDSYTHFPTDTGKNGILDIAAPASGTSSGLALYQDPRLTNNNSKKKR
jgi:hypothetical protein